MGRDGIEWLVNKFEPFEIEGVTDGELSIQKFSDGDFIFVFQLTRHAIFTIY